MLMSSIQPAHRPMVGVSPTPQPHGSSSTSSRLRAQASRVSRDVEGIRCMQGRPRAGRGDFPLLLQPACPARCLTNRACYRSDSQTSVGACVGVDVRFFASTRSPRPPRPQVCGSDGHQTRDCDCRELNSSRRDLPSAHNLATWAPIPIADRRTYSASQCCTSLSPREAKSEWARGKLYEPVTSSLPRLAHIGRCDRMRGQ